MTKRFFRLFLMTIVLTGCVSKNVYQKALDESEARRANLEQTQNEVARLQEQNRQLTNRADEQSRHIGSLSSEAGAAKKERDELSRQVAALASEGESLKKQNSALASTVSDLKRNVEELTAEKEAASRKAEELAAEKENEVARTREAYENLMKEMKGEIEKGDIKITRAIDRLSVSMVEKILFDSGKANINPNGLKILDRVGKVLKGITNKQIRIEGHTDNVEIGPKIKKKYPTNWELSTARATNVVRYLQEKVGVKPKLLSAAGYSEYKPVAGNETAQGRAQNRRMEIAILPLDVGGVLEELKKK